MYTRGGAALLRYCKRRFHQSAGDDALRADIFNVNAHLWAKDPSLRAEVRSRVPRVPREYPVSTSGPTREYRRRYCSPTKCATRYGSP